MLLVPIFASVRVRGDVEADENLLRSAMAALESYLNWTPLASAFQFNVPEACAMLLRDPGLRDCALDCLDVIAKTRGNRARDCEEKIKVVLFPLLVSVAREHNVSTTGFDADLNSFQKRLTDVFATAGISFFDLAFTTPGAIKEIEPAAAEFLQLMLELLLHPSIAISTTSLRFWSSYFRGKVAVLEPFQAFVPRYLPVSLCPPPHPLLLIVLSLRKPMAPSHPAAVRDSSCRLFVFYWPISPTVRLRRRSSSDVSIRATKSIQLQCSARKITTRLMKRERLSTNYAVRWRRAPARQIVSLRCW